MAKKSFDNVRHLIATIGSGVINLGTVPETWQSFAAAGAVDGDQPSYEIIDGAQRENGYLTLANSVTTASRTVTSSSNGNAPIILSGSAVLTCVPIANVFNKDMLSVASIQNLSPDEKGIGLDNLGATTVGKALFVAADQAAARNALGATETGHALMTAPPDMVVRVDVTQTLSAARQARGRANISVMSPPQGRLTLQSGVPVMSTTQAAKAMIYYTTYLGNQVPIYDGASTVMTAFMELSASTADTTKSPAAIGASKVNDWFIWNDAGTLRLSHGPDWTNDTTRSAGTALTMVNGIWLNNAMIANGPAASRGTYVGTTRSNSSSQLDFVMGTSGTAGWVGIWNAYNRRPCTMTASDTASNWTYQTGAARASNNGVVSRVSFVSGLQEDTVEASFNTRVTIGGTNGYTLQGFALDSTSTFSARSLVGGSGTATNAYTNHAVRSSFSPLLGFHYIASIEEGDGVTPNLVHGYGYANLTVTLWS